MGTKTKTLFFICLTAFIVFGLSSNKNVSIPNKKKETSIEPLRSWSTIPKAKIIDWVKAATDSRSSSYIPVSDRIAVFDNDGTLWPEQPVPNQLAFALDYLKSNAAQHPEWQKDPDLKVFLNEGPLSPKDITKSGLLKLVTISHSNITETDFNKNVKNWIETAKDAKFKKRYKDLVYQPMLELLDYLHQNGFTTFIVSWVVPILCGY